MKGKPRLSFWQIWNMSFGFLGIQFGFALQNANVSRIFETLGANIEDIPILWIAAPVTGLIVQPIIGHMSDRTWNRLGRRRPYFLSGAILASIALVIMPNSPMLWVAAGMLWIMDASINISMEPFRAFVGDMLPSEQRTRGFAMQSFFIGIGAVIASGLPWMMTNWLNIPNVAPEGEIPPSVKFSFYVGAAAFLLAVLWTVIRTKEYPPEKLEEFEKAQAELEKTKETVVVRKKEVKYFRNFIFWIIIGLALSWLVYHYKLAQELYVLGFGLTVFGLIQLVAGIMKSKGATGNGFYTVVDDMFNMPKTMAQLAFVQFFSWFALFAMWINTVNGVTATHFDMKINEEDYQRTAELIERSKRADQEDKQTDFQTEMQHIEKRIVAGASSSMSINLTKYLISDSVLLERQKLNAFIKMNEYFLKNEETREYFEDPGEEVPMPVVRAVREKLNKLELNGLNKNDIQYWLKLKHIQQEYNDGADWVGILFAIYNGMAAAFAFLLMWMAKLTNRKITHIVSLLIGGLGFISIYFIANPYMLTISFVAIGLVWASILAMPYAILTGSLPQNKLGVYMGIFNFFIVIPQIVAASILGFFVSTLFNGEAIYSLVVGGVSLFIAAVFTGFVNDVDYVKVKK
ncbi:MAG: MFS transporter [Bacteroidales bacterium]|nr:MFS transporter [Bacteroidales bacterium]MCF8350007.1 MFS transporter [Bacteroidales bacterium]MCF8376364.1 MFS transporter [Bacteroidales bacterium]MCF8400530.1 MFS transporter [Bacteroidales bacterium]